MSSAAIGDALAAALVTVRSTTDWLLAASGPDDVLAGATPYLRMMGVLTGGWLLTRAALAAGELGRGDGGGFDPEFLEQKVVTARFFATQVLPQVGGLAPAVTAGADDLFTASF